MNIEQHKDYLLVRFGDIWSKETGYQVIEEIKLVCKKSGLRRILFDQRQHTEGSSIFSDFTIAEKVAEDAQKINMESIAVLSLSKFQKNDSFFENVAANRGLNIKYFYSTEEEALQWLLESE